MSHSWDISVHGRQIVTNDYNQNFVDTGEHVQNFIRDVTEQKRFEKYPKLERLIQLKREIIKARATPPMYIKADLKSYDLKQLGMHFDVVLIDPPWQEYYDRCGGACSSEDVTPWSLEDIEALSVNEITATSAFCFLWCGVDHLEDARELFQLWGFRRCEDLCWLKINRAFRDHSHMSKKSSSLTHSEHSVLKRTTEHCLVGIKGPVKRSNDCNFIHSNIDTDLIVHEEPFNAGSTEKPPETYDIIERFCLGRRRLELFATNRNIRPGWVSIGKEINQTNWNPSMYQSWMSGNNQWPQVKDYNGGTLVGTSQEIEALRPRSPPKTFK